MEHTEIFQHDVYQCSCGFITTSESEWKKHQGKQKIQRYSMATKAGNTLSFFYNPENDLLVVDLVHKNDEIGNEIVRKTLNEKKLLAHT